MIPKLKKSQSKLSKYVLESEFHVEFENDIYFNKILNIYDDI